LYKMPSIRDGPKGSMDLRMVLNRGEMAAAGEARDAAAIAGHRRVDFAVAACVRWLLPWSWHNHDGAVRVACHLVADRAEHQPREPAAATGAHH